MHEFQHVITGHSAVGSIKQALGIDDGDIVNQLDDLSIGPLVDVDAPHAPVRIDFLKKVWGAEPGDVESDFGLIEDVVVTTARRFRDLPQDPRPCLVWFGSNAYEQLTLRRTAHVLAGSPRSLWGIEVLAEDQRPLPQHWCTSVAVLNPKELGSIFARRRPIAEPERSRLAGEWSMLCAESSGATMRHFADGRIETRAIGSYDRRIRDSAGVERGNMARLVGDVMGHTEDAYVSDIFLAWRVYELAAQGMLEIDRPGTPMRENRVRRVT